MWLVASNILEEQAASIFRVDMITVRMWQGVTQSTGKWQNVDNKAKEEEEGGRKSPVQSIRNGTA